MFEIIYKNLDIYDPEEEILPRWFEASDDAKLYILETIFEDLFMGWPIDTPLEKLEHSIKSILRNYSIVETNRLGSVELSDYAEDTKLLLFNKIKNYQLDKINQDKITIEQRRKQHIKELQQQLAQLMGEEQGE